jgi:hypothetical protein
MRRDEIQESDSGFEEVTRFERVPTPDAVYTGKDNVALNTLGLGFERRGEAQVLFTTQAKLLVLSRFRTNFAANTNFHYLGRARQIRIWDESILPIDTLTLSPDQLETVAGWLFRVGQDDVAKLVRDFAHQLGVKGHDSTIKVPTLPPLAEIADFDRANGAEREALEQAWSILDALGGSEVRVYCDKHSGAVMISSRDVLPRLLAPLLVLDANADKRAIYRQWRASVGLHHLNSPKKTYHNLTIHFAELRAGKEAHRDTERRQALVETAVTAFEAAMKLGADRVLFLHNKPEKPSRNMERLIRREIKKRGGDPERAAFLTWGLHKATNEYKDVRHVVAIGVMQAPLYEITAMARGVARVPIHKPIDRVKVEEVRQSEILHTLFQGVGRSAVRKTVNGDVPEGVHLWLIASTLGHMPFPKERLEDWFPGATVEEWESFPCRPKRKNDDRPRFVEAVLAKNGTPCITVADFKAEGFRPRTAQKFLNDEDVKDCLKSSGYALKRGDPERSGGAYCYSLSKQRGTVFLLER